MGQDIVPIMSDDDQVQKSVINPFPKLVAGPQLLHELAFHHGLLDELAVQFKSADASYTALSYGSLHHRSLHFAAKLRQSYDKLDVPSNDLGVVPLFLPQSPELYVAMLAVLEIGAAFCPLNLDAPEDRLEFIIRDVGARMVVTTALDSEKLKTIPNLLFCIIDDNDPQACNSSGNFDAIGCSLDNTEYPRPSPSDWAYIMYTSGSTGQPKGVTLSHRAVTQSLLAHDSGIPKYSRFLQFASPTFDVSMFEIFFTFSRGSTLVGCNRKELLNNLPGIIDELNVDAAELTPTVAGSLLGKRRDVPKLRVLLTIGEMLTRNVIEEFGASHTQCPMLYGMYGPTEAAIHCTMEPEFASSSKNGIIGRPLETVSAFIGKPVDPESPSAAVEILPVGEIGELIIGGHQLADGYLNREEQTKSVFVHHETYGRLYRTGDKSRVLPDGSLECLGRIETGQVKLRGQRIELGEIEQAAMQTEGCRVAIASIIRDNIVIFCLVGGDTVRREHIFDTCKKWLLPYMIPHDVVIERRFPQLASGKIDRKSLESSYDTVDGNDIEDRDSEEDTELTIKICQAAQKVLNTPVHTTLDLTKVGLDSLRSIQLVSQLRKYGIETNALDVLKGGSVRSICCSLRNASEQLDLSVFKNAVSTTCHAALEQSELEGRQQNIAEILPCTPLQASMLVETLKDDQAYCNWIELEFEDGFTANTVFKAFGQLFEAKEMLRSGFVAVEDSSTGFAQVVWKDYEQDQVSYANADFKRDFKCRTPDEFLRPSRVSIFESRSSKIRAVIQLHHALYDGWSMDLLVQDLNEILNGNRISERPSFKRLTEYLLAAAESSITDESRDYWEQRLGHFQPLLFPDFLSGERPSEHHLLLKTSRKVCISPKAIASRHLFHPQVFFQSALAYLWAAYLGSTEVTFGCVSSGRTLPVPDLENIIGPCISTLPLRVDLCRSENAYDLLSEIHRSNHQILQHCTLTLQEIKKLAGVDPGIHLFDVVFTWQESLTLENGSLKNVRQIDSADFLESKLLIEVEPRNDSIMLKASQRGHNLPESQVEFLLQQIEQVVRCLVEKSSAELSDLAVSDICNLIPENLLSARTISREDISLEISHCDISHVLQTETFACVVSEDLRTNVDWNVLPIGSMGTLSFLKDQDCVYNHLESLESTTVFNAKYGVMYRTPYVCRMYQDGQVRILGTRKDFAWLNKKIINLDAISTIVRQLPDVESCFTFVSEHHGQEILVTLWVPGQNFKANVDFQSKHLIQNIGLPAVDRLIIASRDILDSLRCSTLPTCMIPARMVPIGEIPLDDHKKSELAAAYSSLPIDGYLEHFEALKSGPVEDLSKDRLELERNIADALATSLRVPSSDYGRSTSFFRLGLDSISAISVARAINNRLPGLDVDVSSILRYPTVGRLAAHFTSQRIRIRNGETSEAEYHLNSAISESVRTVYESQQLHVESIRPCTPLQEGMLATTSNEAYYNHALFELFLDANRFSNAFNIMCRRHDILRTCFASTEDPQSPFVQVVLKDFTIPWRTVYKSSGGIDSAVEDIVNQNLAALDTMTPPLSITELQTNKASYILFSLHHALYDGEAMSQLLKEIQMNITGQQLQIVPSFDKFLQNSIATDFRKSDEFWDHLLKDFLPRPLPQMADGNIAEASETAAGRILLASEILSIRLSDVQRAAKAQSITIQTLFQTAWAKLLFVLLDTNDICFGNVISGRTLPINGLEQLVAPCFNTIPVRIQFPSILSNEKAAYQLQNSNAEALIHQFTPLRRIQARLNLYGTRLFDTLFILQKPQIKLDQSLWSMRKEFGDMGFPVVCEIVPDPQYDSLKLTLHLNRRFSGDSGARTLFDTFNASLRSCVSSPRANFKQFDYSLLKKKVVEKEQLRENLDTGTNKIGSESVDFENDETTRKIRQVLSRFSKLPVEHILPNKTIYQLGLDSISAIQIAKVLRNEGFQVSSEHIMEGKTLHGIAGLIQHSTKSTTHGKNYFDFANFDRQNRSQACSLHHIDESLVSVVRPCTQSQAGMISQFLTTGGKAYLNHMVYELNSEIEIDKLQRAWMSALDGHEMLRTGFSTCNDAKYSFVMIQYLASKFELPWKVFDTKNGESYQSPIDTLRRTRDLIAEQILHKLEQPPWRLSIARNHTDGNLMVQFSAHHALYDAESLRMIFSDVTNAYNNNPLQFQISIDPLLSGIIFGEADEHKIHEEFWQSKLRNMALNKFPDLTPLRPSKRLVQNLSVTLRNVPELEQSCRDLGITLQAALQVAWARLISDYLGEADVTFGVVLSGRDIDGADEIPFPSTTTVPYRCIVRDDIDSMLQYTMAYNTAVRKHQHSPLTEIKRWTGFPNCSLFDTLLVFQVAEEETEDAAYSLWRLKDEEATVEYPLSIEIMLNKKKDLVLRAVFWDDTLPVPQARLLLLQLSWILNNTILGRRDDNYRHFPDELVSKLPPKISEIPSNRKTLHGLVEATAREYPDRAALEFVQNLEDDSYTRTWTYQELEHEGNRLANLLIELGATPRSLIATCFDKSPEASFAMLGILKAGCGFLCLDPTAPPARKAFILEDSQSFIILTVKSLSRDMDFHESVQVVSVDSLNPDYLNSTKPQTSDNVEASDVSYCLYTSGSTGTPKGCLLSHENAVQAMLAFQRIFHGRWDASSRWLQFASFHFDVSVLEQFWSWSVGICVVSTPRDQLFADLAGGLKRLKITHIDLTPSLARLITPEQIPSLCNGVFITGGEPLKQEVLDAWGLTGVIHNGYGPTECTIGCTMYPRVPQHGKPANIGWQFDNVGTYVLAPGTTNLIPRGGIGELCVSGKLVGLGYLNRSDLTAESFPYVEEFQERIYRTKDLVRMLHDGSFEFLGRNDDQVKLRGQRLELGEINNAITANVEAVHEAVTIITKRSDNQSEQLVSFLALGRSTSEIFSYRSSEVINDAKSACQVRLPGYMVPSHILLLESMPLTSNNKSDVNKLKDLFNQSLEVRSDSQINASTEPSSLHKTVSRILANFLSIPEETISPASNVFELGLDSISAFAFSRALQNEGYSGAQPGLILQNGTIHGIVKGLGDVQFADQDVIQAKHEMLACHKRHQASIARRLGRSIEDVESVIPCTPLQQGMIVTSLEMDGRPYFNTFWYELNTELRVFQDAFDDIVASIPLLRTVFVPTEKEYVQVVLHKSSYQRHWHKYEDLPDDTVEETVRRLRDEWFEENQEIFKEPFQAIALQSQGRYYVVLNIFHALYDATGLSLLLKKLDKRLCNIEPVEYGPFFHDALAFGPLKKIKPAESFWKDKLKDAQFNPISREKTGSVRNVSRAMCKLENIDNFEYVRRHLGLTHQALVQSVWTAVLYDFIQMTTIIGVVVSGRSIAFSDAENIIGPMFNTIPVFTHISRDDTWGSLAQRCHDFNMAALPFQHTSLRDIQKWCKPSGRGSLFDTLFVFQKDASQSSTDMSPFWKNLSSNVHADYPLAFEAEHTAAGTLNITIVAQSHVADETTCDDLLKRFKTNFNLLLAAPNTAVSDNINIAMILSQSLIKTSSSQHEDTPESDSEPFDWSPQARILQRKIKELSGLKEVDVNEHTSIFELGLDSIDAIKLSSALKAMDVNLSVSSIIRNPSIRQMSRFMDELSSSPLSKRNSFELLKWSIRKYVSRIGLETAQFDNVLPATPLQEALVADMYSSQFKNYFNHDILRLMPDVDVETLMEAIATVCINTPILRTSFFQIDSVEIGCSFAQLVHKPKQPNWEKINLSASLNMDDVLDRATNQMVTAYNDVSTSFLIPLKFSIVFDGNARHLVLSMAHALYDGWSIDLFHRDVAKAYFGHFSARPNPEEVLDTVFAGDSDESNGFWHDTVAKTSGCCFPVRDLGNLEARQVHRREHLSVVPLSTIESFCKQQNVGLQAVGHLCWSFVLATYAQSLDVIFGVVLSGRENEDAQRIMFPTMNTVIARSVISGSRSEMLKALQANLADLIQYQHYPLRKVQAMAGIPGGSLFNTLFIYQKRPAEGERTTELYTSIGGFSGVGYPVCVEMELVGDKFLWRSACEEVALSQEGTKNLLRDLDLVLETVIQHPDAASIDFTNEGVSLCGLPAFKVVHPNSGTPDAIMLKSDTDIAPKPTPWIENAVREALSAVSKVPESSILGSDTIFHLGLDSISLIKVSSILRRSSLYLSVGDIMKASTVENIAISMANARSSVEPHRSPDVSSQEIIDHILENISIQQLVSSYSHELEDFEAVLPATPAQVYFLSQWQNSKGSLFFPSFTYQVNGSIDLDSIRIAWNALVKINPILRTSFASTANKRVPIVQLVLQSPRESFLDHSSVGEMSARYWDLYFPPVLLFARKLHSGGAQLCLRIHHALYDAVSLPLLIQQLQDICNNSGQLPNHSHNVTLFRQFIACSASSDALDIRRSFWTAYLTSARNLHPFEVTPSSRALTDARKRTECFRPQSLRIFNEFNVSLRAHGLSIHSVFLATFAAVYGELLHSSQRATTEEKCESNARDVILGVYLANRSHDLRNKISDEEQNFATLPVPTVNLVPLVIRSPLATQLYECAKQIQTDLQKISSLENATVGLWEIDEWTGIKIDCFANFLRLPGDDDSEEVRLAYHKINGTGHGREGSPLPEVTIVPLASQNSTSFDLVTEAKGAFAMTALDEDFSVPLSLQDNQANASYPPSWDIEAAVRDGALDIGIFGPCDIIENHEAELIISKITRKLQAEIAAMTAAG